MKYQETSSSFIGFLLLLIFSSSSAFGGECDKAIAQAKTYDVVRTTGIIVALEGNRVARGTAFRVGRNRILTSAHVIGVPKSERKAFFLPGFDFVELTLSDPDLFLNLKLVDRDPEPVWGEASDWVLMEVLRPDSGESFAWKAFNQMPILPVQKDASSISQQLLVVGFSGACGIDDRLQFAQAFEARKVDRLSIWANINTLFFGTFDYYKLGIYKLDAMSSARAGEGLSGGPVLNLENGNLSVAGIVTSGAKVLNEGVYGFYSLPKNFSDALRKK